MNVTEIRGVYERINNIQSILEKQIKEGHDKDINELLLENVNNTVKQMIEYAKTVFMQFNKDIYNDSDSYRNAHFEKDQNRRITHNSLIVSLALLDRICAKYDAPKVYGNFGKYEEDSSPLTGNTFGSEESEKRREINRWTLYVITYALTEETNLINKYLEEDSKAKEELTGIYSEIDSTEMNDMVSNNIKGK